MGPPHVAVFVFPPFDETGKNSSQIVGEAVAKKLRHRQTATCSLHTLPNSFRELQSVLDRHLNSIPRHSLIVALGQSGPGATCALEMFAHNVIHTHRADAEGYTPPYGSIDTNGPDCRRTPIDLATKAEALTALNLPASVSLSAGTNLCNFTYYHLLATRPSTSVFIHIPYVVSQVADRVGIVEAISDDCAQAVVTAFVTHELDQVHRTVGRQEKEDVLDDRPKMAA